MNELSPLVTFGDSTTASRGPLRTYSDCLRDDLPAKGVAGEVINAGVGGNTTEDALTRFEKDVLAVRPSLVVIQFGINDSALNVWDNPPATQPRVSLNRYVANLEFFIESLQKQNSQVILMTPNSLRWTASLKTLYGKPPYRPDDPDGFNVTLRTYVEGVRELAQKKSVRLIDVYAAFQEYGTRYSMDDLLLDGMHPNEQGHRLVADLLISALLEGL
jgi:lysophospholipase L1-like esterase